VRKTSSSSNGIVRFAAKANVVAESNINSADERNLAFLGMHRVLLRATNDAPENNTHITAAVKKTKFVSVSAVPSSYSSSPPGVVV